MEDFGEAVNKLRQIITDARTIDKWMGQLATYLDKKNIEEDKHPELENAVQILEVADTQSTRAEQLNDAIEYYMFESSRIHQLRKNLWNEIALLRIDNREVEDEISSLGREAANLEVPAGGAKAEIEAEDDYNSGLPTHGLTFIGFNDNDNVKLKRRRSVARIAIDNVKKVATNAIRSRSSSRSRPVHR